MRRAQNLFLLTTYIARVFGRNLNLLDDGARCFT